MWIEEGDSRLCLVTAEGGWGKTAVLTALAQQAKQDGREVFYHFVGSTASSVFHINLVQRLLLALCLDPADPEVRDPEADLQTKMKVLRRLLSVWRAGNRKMLIVIDGVNELDNSESLYHLSWLPPWLPPAVRCVVSSNASHLPTKARLFEHPAYHLALSALDSAALQSLAASFFGNYGKKLESTQLQHLVETTRVDNPLWMTLMCEELRVFGDFRMMDKKLAALPDKMDTFLTSVIHRLLSEDETSCVKKVLFLTACSTTGLPTNSMLKLLGDMDRKAECPPLHWAQARRVLKAYSRTVRASGDREEYYSFVHQAMWKAVRQCMQEREEDPKAWHKQLADFYQYSCDNFILRINYLPFQLQQARLHKRLVEFIRHDRDAARMPAFQRSRLLKEQRCMNPSDAVVPNTREVVMCGMCANRQGGFNPGVYFPNKDVCYLCSNLTFSHSRQPARICFVHAMKNRLGPRNSACCVCGRMVVLGLKNMPLPPGVVAASLCQLCGFGIQGKQCCHMKDLPD